jgi:hypothetical protein
MDPTIQEFCTRWRSVVIFTLRPPLSEESANGPCWTRDWTHITAGLGQCDKEHILPLPEKKVDANIMNEVADNRKWVILQLQKGISTLKTVRKGLGFGRFLKRTKVHKTQNQEP